MHYLPKLLNENGFFLQLASLNPNPKSSSSLIHKIERFLYRGTCALQSLLAMQHSLRESEKLALEYKDQLAFNSKNRVPFACSELFLAYAQIPATLSSIVLMQNQLLRLISELTGQGENIPKSMNDAIKKGIGKFGFDEKITDLINEYWAHSGRYIREVRNVNEHFDALVDYTFFQYKSNIGTVLIFLPDNPETKSPKKFEYNKEKNAIEVLYDGFKSINKLIEEICDLEKIPKGQFRPSVAVNHINDLNNNVEKTLGIFISVEQVKDGMRGLHTMELRQKENNGQPKYEFRNLKTDKEL